MNITTREQIMTALFNLLKNAAPFAMASRRMKLWGDQGVVFPALFMKEDDDTYVQGSEAEPGTVTFGLRLFLYTNPGMDSGVTPATQLNNLLDAVDAALMPNMLTGLLTLGGLVSHCWINGKVMKEQGDLDGFGIAIVPIKIMIPQ